MNATSKGENTKLTKKATAPPSSPESNTSKPVVDSSKQKADEAKPPSGTEPEYQEGNLDEYVQDLNQDSSNKPTVAEPPIVQERAHLLQNVNSWNEEPASVGEPASGREATDNLNTPGADNGRKPVDNPSPGQEQTTASKDNTAGANEGTENETKSAPEMSREATEGEGRVKPAATTNTTAIS